jgi:hypothetical protein
MKKSRRVTERSKEVVHSRIRSNDSSSLLLEELSKKETTLFPPFLFEKKNEQKTSFELPVLSPGFLETTPTIKDPLDADHLFAEQLSLPILLNRSNAVHATVPIVDQKLDFDQLGLTFDSLNVSHAKNVMDFEPNASIPVQNSVSVLPFSNPDTFSPLTPRSPSLQNVTVWTPVQNSTIPFSNPNMFPTSDSKLLSFEANSVNSSLKFNSLSFPNLLSTTLTPDLISFPTNSAANSLKPVDFKLKQKLLEVIYTIKFKSSQKRKVGKYK